MLFSTLYQTVVRLWIENVICHIFRDKWPQTIQTPLCKRNRPAKYWPIIFEPASASPVTRKTVSLSDASVGQTKSKTQTYQNLKGIYSNNITRVKQLKEQKQLKKKKRSQQLLQ